MRNGLFVVYCSANICRHRLYFESRPENLVNHQVLIEFDTQSPSSRGKLRCCEDLFCAVADGSICLQIFGHGRQINCNQTTTALWIKIPILQTRRSIRFALYMASAKNESDQLTSSPSSVLIDLSHLITPTQ